MTIATFSQTLNGSRESIESKLTKMIKELKPQEQASDGTIKALNDALKKLGVKGGEVKKITRGQVWQFEDVYKYLDQCLWHCLSYKSCRYKGMAVRAKVIDGQLEYEYLGCGKFFAMKKCLEWVLKKENKSTLEGLKKALGKEPEDLSLDEWKEVMGRRFWQVVNGEDE